MKAFEYVAPTTVGGAVERLGEQPDASMAMAGGMDLIGLMKDYVMQPDRLVALKDVGDLRGVEETDEGDLRIGAMVTIAEIAADPRVRERWPGLAAAAEAVGTPQIRNRGTIGGNLCQRPRCWYFRSEHYNCLRKGGGACYAVDGDNRYHAIFDTAPCPIVHPSSCAVPLQAYGASVSVAGPGESGVEQETVALEWCCDAANWIRRVSPCCSRRSIHAKGSRAISPCSGQAIWSRRRNDGQRLADR